MVYISRKWRYPKMLIALMILELGGTVAALALFGIASPDLYRSAMWRVGYNNGFNSSPDAILYAYANYRPIPNIPLVWNSLVTQYNVVIAVLTMFILLAKAAMFVMHIWYPLVSTIVNIGIVAIWTFSAYAQAGPDYTDPLYPSRIAWYVSKSCSYADAYNQTHNCVLAKSTFVTTVLMLIIFFTNLVQAIWSMIPTAAEKAARLEEQSESPSSENSGEKLWEMRPVPRTPNPALQPYTPRTLAFNTLDRQLPLRAAS